MLSSIVGTTAKTYALYRTKQHINKGGILGWEFNFIHLARSKHSNWRRRDSCPRIPHEVKLRSNKQDAIMVTCLNEIKSYIYWNKCPTRIRGNKEALLHNLTTAARLHKCICKNTRRYSDTLQSTGSLGTVKTQAFQAQVSTPPSGHSRC